MTSNGWRARARDTLGGYSPLLRWYRRFRPLWLWPLLHPLGKATILYVERWGLDVRRGPFAGLRYPREAVGRVGFLPAKLLGSYERELYTTLESLEGMDCFVDLGSGDGFYCVGIGRRFNSCRIIGYETDKSERRIAGLLAATNGVRAELRGTVDHRELDALPDGKVVVMCDLEGYECELLDPVRVPRLRATTMLVELHEDPCPEVVTVLTERFRLTHEILVLSGTPRSPADFPELENWDPELAGLAVAEGRSTLAKWMLLTPGAGPSTSYYS